MLRLQINREMERLIQTENTLKLTEVAVSMLFKYSSH